MPTSPLGEEVINYCEKFPTAPDLTLAKIIYRDHPKLFTDVEHARTRIRYYRGHAGKKDRKSAKRHKLLKPITHDTNPFKLPASHAKPTEGFRLPTSIKKILFLSDLHFPYHNTEAINAAIQEGKKENVDCVYINGDLLDFYQVSHFLKDPRKADMFNELELGKEFFGYLRQEFPKANIYYVPGNHEIRLEKYLMVKAPELLGIPEFRLDVLLNVREHDVVFIPHGSKIYFGKLLVEHGDKLRGTGGVSPARTLALKFKRHCISGHWHRTNEAISKVYDSDSFVTYSVGCLCELEPEYMPVNDHNHGFAIIEMMKNGDFMVKNKKIENGKVY